MPYKPMPADDKIEALANQFRAIWCKDQAVRPWLRKHAVMLQGLVRDDWPWAGVASALRRAGIIYQTGREWGPEQLRAEIAAACRPLKDYSTKPVIEKALPNKNIISGETPKRDDGLVSQQDHGLQIPSSARTPKQQSRNRTVLPVPSVPPVSDPRFKPVVIKPYAPPEQVSLEERTAIEENKRRVLGY